MSDRENVELLVAAQRRYQLGVGHYDETLHHVTASIAAAGSAGKADIGALVFWKRLRADTPWTSAIQHIRDEHVRDLTRIAVAVVNDPALSLQDAGRLGREALLELPGFKSGPALPSALLLAAAPERMAVYDRRAEAGLQQLGLSSGGRYSTYMSVLEELLEQLAAAGHRWRPRDVDTALFTLGGPREAPEFSARR